MIKKIFIAIAFIVASIGLNAQTNNANHPTIGNLTVAYKSVPQGTNSIGMMDMKCIPQATITLKPNVNASKIYFKIINPQTNVVVYQVNYLLNSASIINNDGITVFENSNGVIKISNAQIVSLRPYVYELQTENSQSVLSTVYSVTK